MVPAVLQGLFTLWGARTERFFLGEMSAQGAVAVLTSLALLYTCHYKGYTLRQLASMIPERIHKETDFAPFPLDCTAFPPPTYNFLIFF